MARKRKPASAFDASVAACFGISASELVCDGTLDTGVGPVYLGVWATPIEVTVLRVTRNHRPWWKRLLRLR